MMTFEARQIENLSDFEITHLVEESQKEGFRFLQRLMDDYNNGTSIFNKPGEILYGVFEDNNILIAIGGLNIDPYSNQPEIGRLRRFYVAKNYRRKGIGRFLLENIISIAHNHYKVLVLHTDTEQAGDFYTSLGFVRGNSILKAPTIKCYNQIAN